jgi:hypothetical protein
MNKYDKETKPLVGSKPWIDEIFTYHAPTDAQKVNYENIRSAAKEFVIVLLANTPKCADQSAAIRLVRDAVMTSNASVALEGLI